MNSIPPSNTVPPMQMNQQNPVMHSSIQPSFSTQPLNYNPSNGNNVSLYMSSGFNRGQYPQQPYSDRGQNGMGGSMNNRAGSSPAPSSILSSASSPSIQPNGPPVGGRGTNYAYPPYNGRSVPMPLYSQNSMVKNPMPQQVPVNRPRTEMAECRPQEVQSGMQPVTRPPQMSSLQSMRPVGMSQPGMSQPGMPQAGMPQTGMPQTGMPQAPNGAMKDPSAMIRSNPNYSTFPSIFHHVLDQSVPSMAAPETQVNSARFIDDLHLCDYSYEVNLQKGTFPLQMVIRIGPNGYGLNLSQAGNCIFVQDCRLNPDNTPSPALACGQIKERDVVVEVEHTPIQNCSLDDVFDSRGFPSFRLCTF